MVSKSPDEASTVKIPQNEANKAAKETAAAARARDKGFTIGGVAKGSGMIHPDLATMFCFQRPSRARALRLGRGEGRLDPSRVVLPMLR